MEKLSEQQTKSMFRIMEELEGVVKEMSAYSSAGKTTYLEDNYPDIDFDVSCNLGDIDVTEDKRVFESIQVGGRSIQPNLNLHPLGMGIDWSTEKDTTAIFIRDEEEYAEFTRSIQNVMMETHSYVGSSTRAFESRSPEPEKLSPKERKKRYREGLQKMAKKGKRW